MSSKNNDDHETIGQKKNIIIKQLNDTLDEIIDKSKSFEEQLKSLKKKRKSRRVLVFQRLW